MALLTRSQLLGHTGNRREELVKSVAARILLEKVAAAPIDEEFDVFLSHSSKDAREVLGIKTLFKKLGYKIYIDWIDDDKLDRSAVTKNTAKRLRRRIAASRSLLVHATAGAISSRWVPW